MKLIIIILVLIPSFLCKSQHTFSIVAVDSTNGEIGSAGATCGDSIIWPGTPGAYIISDITPGVGAIHTQAYHNVTNQSNARNRMSLGESPQDIITWLVANDASLNPSNRQYGIVDYNAGNPRSAAYTGVNCFDYKNHILGPNYSIQGNILLGQEILDSMEYYFNNTEGCLSDKLMAAMQGANVIGADTRCTSEETSSLSAFLRVAQPNDHPDSLFIDINIAGTPTSVEPINVLQTKYNLWKLNNVHNCNPFVGMSKIDMGKTEFLVYPNPTDALLNVKVSDKEITKIVVSDIVGKIIFEKIILKSNEATEITLPSLPDGIYFLTLFDKNTLITTEKIEVKN